MSANYGLHHTTSCSKGGSLGSVIVSLRGGPLAVGSAGQAALSTPRSRVQTIFS